MTLDPASLISTLSTQLTSSLEDSYLVCAGRTSSRTGHALAPEAQWDSGGYATPHFSIVYLAVLLLSVLILFLSHTRTLYRDKYIPSSKIKYHPLPSPTLQATFPTYPILASPKMGPCGDCNCCSGSCAGNCSCSTCGVRTPRFLPSSTKPEGPCGIHHQHKHTRLWIAPILGC